MPASPLETVRAQVSTEQGAYGIILVAGLIVVSGAGDYLALTVFIKVAVTVVVFWAAHVYAGTIAHYGVGDGQDRTLGASLRHALRASWGLLVSALIPVCILLLGVFEVVPDRSVLWLALWVCVGMLAIVGYLAFARRGAPWYVRLLGSATTASFGILMILLKALVH